MGRWFSGVPQGHNEFDVSFKGFALVQKDEHCTTSQKAFEIAGSLLKDWNNYLSGNVWEFCVKDKDDNNIASCCGFYGDPNESGCIDEAKSEVDYRIKDMLNKRVNNVKVWIKNHVPLSVRNELIKELI